MDRNECKDRLFDVLNDAECLPIQDLICEDKNDTIHVYLTDGTRFSIHIEQYGRWELTGEK